MGVVPFEMEAPLRAALEGLKEGGAVIAVEIVLDTVNEKLILGPLGSDTPLAGVHEALPFFDGFRPSGHSSQCPKPESLVTFPSAQRWHSYMPVSLPNSPGKHGKQLAVPFLLCVYPVGHASQNVAFMPPVRYRPGSHTSQPAPLTLP